MSTQIEITGVDLRLFVKEVYNLSNPQGMGYLHYTPEPLSEAEVDEILFSSDPLKLSVHMDYVRGRSCKINVFNKDGKLFINSPWYDHTETDLEELLSRCKIAKAA